MSVPANDIIDYRTTVEFSTYLKVGKVPVERWHDHFENITRGSCKDGRDVGWMEREKVHELGFLWCGGRD